MISNTTNCNSDFQDFSKCDYQKHWSWSILFKNVIICEAIKNCKNVLEVGAADSNIEAMLNTNFGKYPTYTKTDIKNYPGTSYLDITMPSNYEAGTFDGIVFSEVIEHLPKDRVSLALNELRKLLSITGVLVLTCPTPRKSEGMDMVWPDCHDQEYSLPELIDILVPHFRIIDHIGWHDRDFCTPPLSNSSMLPGSLNRALLSLDADSPTQIAMKLYRRY